MSTYVDNDLDQFVTDKVFGSAGTSEEAQRLGLGRAPRPGPSIVVNGDRLDALYRAWRPHRTLALAVRYLPVLLMIFGPLGMAASAVIWWPIVRENLPGVPAAMVLIIVIVLTMIYLVCVWLQWGILSLLINYLRFYGHKLVVALSQIAFSALVAGLALWSWVAPLEFYLAEPGLSGAIDHLLSDTVRPALLGTIIFAPVALAMVVLATDIGLGALRLATASELEYAAVRGPVPSWRIRYWCGRSRVGWQCISLWAVGLARVFIGSPFPTYAPPL